MVNPDKFYIPGTETVVLGFKSFCIEYTPSYIKQKNSDKENYEKSGFVQAQAFNFLNQEQYEQEFSQSPSDHDFWKETGVFCVEEGKTEEKTINNVVERYRIVIKEFNRDPRPAFMKIPGK